MCARVHMLTSFLHRSHYSHLFSFHARSVSLSVYVPQYMDKCSTLRTCRTLTTRCSLHTTTFYVYIYTSFFSHVLACAVATFFGRIVGIYTLSTMSYDFIAVNVMRYDAITSVYTDLVCVCVYDLFVHSVYILSAWWYARTHAHIVKHSYVHANFASFSQWFSLMLLRMFVSFTLSSFYVHAYHVNELEFAVKLKFFAQISIQL